MLTAARNLVRQQGLVSLQEIALKLGVPADVARAVLQKWVDKGRIERLPMPSTCAGCTLCDSAPRELYRWRENAADGDASAPSTDQSKDGCNTRVPSSCPAAGPFQDQR